MKVCVVQPYYSFDKKELDKCYKDMCALVEGCDDSLDIIVLPEYSDIPADTDTKASFHASVERYNEEILAFASATAKRCHAIVFVNAADKTPTGYRNTTHAFDREGNAVGKYYKAHPAPSEVKTEKEGGNEVDVSYSYTAREPYVLEIEGLRFGFMTCYDFYFYEGFAPLARENVDIIIGCSHQRTDTHEALSIINRFLCYNTNAYLLRSAVSLGEDSEVCGCSSIIAPDGKVLADMRNEVGLAIREIDPKAKYYKAAGYKGAPKAHYQYIEEGRRPWLYRNGGAAMKPQDKYLPYPRLCAHRGFNTIAPECSLAAYGAAVALGAEEIEMDLWATKDGVLVVSHDETLERVSNGSGKITEKTYEQLLELDFGVGYGENFKGTKIVTFEEILRRFASQVIMNLHIKIWDARMEDDRMDQILSLIKRYDAEGHVYFMSRNDEKLKELKERYPEARICVGWDENKEDMKRSADRAIALGAEKVQFFAPFFDEEAVNLAKTHGIICNVFFADDPKKAEEYLNMGIDTVLTNDYLTVKNYLEEKNLI